MENIFVRSTNVQEGVGIFLLQSINLQWEVWLSSVAPKLSEIWLPETLKWSEIWLSGIPKWSEISILKILNFHYYLNEAYVL